MEQSFRISSSAAENSLFTDLGYFFGLGDSQSVEEEVLDDEDMDAEDSGSQKADEKLIAEGDGKKRLVEDELREGNARLPDRNSSLSY